MSKKIKLNKYSLHRLCLYKKNNVVLVPSLITPLIILEIKNSMSHFVLLFYGKISNKAHANNRYTSLNTEIMQITYFF